ACGSTEALGPLGASGSSRLSAQDDHEEVIRAKSGRSPNSAVGSSVEHPLGVGSTRADVMNAPPCPSDTSVSYQHGGNARVYFAPELKELADALARRREDGCPKLAFEFLKFLLAEGIVTEGFKGGKPGIAITFKGKQVAANKADFEALCMK